MKNVFKIVKKELDKIFKFPRTIFTTIVLPGLMLFVIYSLLGNSMSNEEKKLMDHLSVIYIIDAPESFDFALDSAEQEKIDFFEGDLTELDGLLEQVLFGEIDLVLVYGQNFDNEIIVGNVPSIKLYYNPWENNSKIAYSKMMSLIDQQKTNILTSLNIDPNIFAFETEELFDEKKAMGSGLAMLMPVLLLTFIFAGAMAIGSDAIAGEKERGTLATLLMTPIKRKEIILGKITSTTILNICYAISSAVGLIAAIPYMKTMFAAEGNIISYATIDYLALFGIIMVLSIFASSVLLVTSTIAKTVKEASMLSMPIYMVAMILPIISMSSQGKEESFSLYLIPIYNCILGIKGVLSGNMDLVNYLLIIGSMIIYVLGIVFLLINLFKREKVLFSK